jgi:hypothetical protein
MLFYSGENARFGLDNVAASMLFSKQGLPDEAPFDRDFKKLTAAKLKSAKMPHSRG